LEIEETAAPEEADSVALDNEDETAGIAAANIPTAETETDDTMSMGLLPGWVEVTAYFNAETG
jgi:hypothetical protein